LLRLRFNSSTGPHPRRQRVLRYEFRSGLIDVPLNAVDRDRSLSYRDTAAAGAQTEKFLLLRRRLFFLGWQRSRPLYAVLYIPEGCPPLPGEISEEELLSRLRAEPPTVRLPASLHCAYPYSASVVCK
jgi:hypothetical protein